MRDVRLLQAGRIVTGIVDEQSRAHRVYVQRPQGARSDDFEAECTCAEPGPCTHVAAVCLAAAQLTPGVTPASRPLGVVQTGAPRTISTQRQCLYYLFEEHASAEGLASSMRVSIWIGPKIASSKPLDAAALVPFALRATDRSDEFPRYVDETDKIIIRSLVALGPNAPWLLHGETGGTLFHQCAASGRALWKSLQSRPLQAARTRQVPFAWEIMPNGDQRLCAQVPPSMHVALNLEPAIYVDANALVWGTVQTPCPTSVLRAYANQPPTPPEHVAERNEQLAREASAASLPKLRPIAIRAQSLMSLEPKLVLTAGPSAHLHFIYNGLDVDSRSLRPQGAARRMSLEPQSDVCLEVPRDQDAERRFKTQLDEYLSSAQQASDAWLAFMMHAVPLLQAQGWSVHVEDDFPYRIVMPDGWYADLDMRHKDDWFDLHLGVAVDGEQINLLPALVSYLQGELSPTDAASIRVDQHLLIRLADGRYLPVPLERIERIADTLVELHEQRSLNTRAALSLPCSQASRIAQLRRELDAPQLRSSNPELRTLIEELADVSPIVPVEPPATFRASLRAYQQEGLGWLQFLRRHRLGGILADDMGLGKTVQTLAHLMLEKAAGRLHAPSLIVAPVSVIGNWRAELNRFAPELNVVTLHGSRRKEHFGLASRADVVLTGYPSLQNDAEFLLSREFYFLILDEAQMIKNPRAKVSQVARQLRATHRLCLTGTPMENHLGELWSLFDFLQPGLLGDERSFQRHYRTPIEKQADEKRAEALRRRIAPFILRRTKEAIARELPPKTQIVESLVLEDEQRDFYDGIRLAMHRRVQEVIQEQGLARSHITVLDALLKLRQACCDPRLVRDDADTRSLPSAKLDWLRTALPELVAEGRRILLFSQFASMLRLIESTVTELQIPYCVLTGETKNRTDVVRRFQSGAVPLFLISLKAGGVGLNLTAADTVIHYDPWWNPAVEAQATDRAHRIGQDQPVFVYKLIAQGTIEEKIMQLQADKHALTNQLYSQHAGTFPQWTAEDIDALFAP